MSNIKYQISNKKRGSLRIGYWKLDIRNWIFPNGFTLIEMLVVIGILLTLISLTTISLTRIQSRVNLTTTVNDFIADLREQQTRAMVGDTGTGLAPDNFGIHFDANSYTLFEGTYYATGSANFAPSLPSVVQISSTFSGGNILFSKGSGEANSTGSVTFTNTASNEQKTIILNKYGVVTAVN